MHGHLNVYIYIYIYFEPVVPEEDQEEPQSK